MAKVVKAGWYWDEHNDLRYWTGKMWNEHVVTREAHLLAKKEGWLSDGFGGTRWFDGQSWSFSFRPPPPLSDPNAPAGWFPAGPHRRRWWSGSAWAEAYVADNPEFVSVLDSVGQGIVSFTILGGTSETATARLRQELANWPPCRVVSLNTYTSPVAAGTSLTAVIEWNSQPDARIV